MTLQRAELTLSADVDNDGTQEDGVFVLEDDITIQPQVRTGFLIGGRGSEANSIIQDNAGGGTSSRAGLYLDLGGGQHVIEIEFSKWEGAPQQWGNTGDDTELTQGDATGADPITQMGVLMRYLTVGTYDSVQPATLEYGEYSDSGLYSPLDVVIEGPQVRRSAEDGSWIDGTLTCIETVDVNEQALDGEGLRG